MQMGSQDISLRICEMRTLPTRALVLTGGGMYHGQHKCGLAVLTESIKAEVKTMDAYECGLNY